MNELHQKRMLSNSRMYVQLTNDVVLRLLPGSAIELAPNDILFGISPRRRTCALDSSNRRQRCLRCRWYHGKGIAYAIASTDLVMCKTISHTAASREKKEKMPILLNVIREVHHIYLYDIRADAY